ncbi:unnamed protein product [Somion occarium]|uniref:tryptophan--tRNA ligase n=1 Tax=Somion occarium TaxID=3059160 RepID=A0ABP1D606_9APHY
MSSSVRTFRVLNRCSHSLQTSRLRCQHVAKRFNSTKVTEEVKHGSRPRTVFSGIQPTGIPHLGNLCGALLNWVELQKNAHSDDVLIFSIVGWHALTLPQDPKTLSAARRDMMAVILAIGIDPERSILFHQDDNPHHTDLAWLFNCITPVGKLRRMTTWKSKLATSRNADESEVDESLLNAGLLTYPVLQAADILLYRATHVPVGEDQKQHLELSRDIADTFNHTFKGKPRLFPLPEYVETPSRRILSLRDPTSKMSKSAPDVDSRILLTDSDTQIQSKFRRAVTDSTVGVTYDPVGRPGVSNLLTILAACTGENVLDVAKRFKSKGLGDLKAEVTDAVVQLIQQPRAEFERLRDDPAYLSAVALQGATKSRLIGEETMKVVRSRVGLT